MQVANQLVDISSGSVTTYPLTAMGSFVFAISPDERHMITMETCDGPQPDSRVYIYDRSVDETRLLKDCDGRYAYSFDWLADSRHVLMAITDNASESPNRAIVLKDVETGDETPLTDGIEFSAGAIPSPDRQLVLVTGDSLHLYDSSGLLLQQVEPPTGFSVIAAAWSPDGQRFAYLIGPTGVWGI
ncbi:MAG: hypothetical protein GEU75_10510 [Dehalococcoidia bacterium]|nr:hypothetical protein [Dehalococcoidia bacterium]